MKTLHEEARDIPAIEADVFVAGAGTAGCIAAIAAARAGASVVLVEKMPVPGGTYTNGGIGTSSFYAASQDPETAIQIVDGLPFELTRRLEEMHGGTGHIPVPNDHHFNPYRFVGDHEVFKGVISQMLMEAGIKVYLQTMFCGVKMDGQRIVAAIIENKDGRSAVMAKQYIDCSGDGDIARFAGVPQKENWQGYNKVCGGPTGLVFGMAGVDMDRFVKENPRGAHEQIREETPYEGIVSRRFIFTPKMEPERYQPVVDLDMNYFTTMQSIHEGEMTYINNSKGPYVDASTADGLSQGEMAMRIKIMEFCKAFRICVPGFEKAYLSWASTQLGIRASKVTICDKTISQEEISNAARFDDEIGLYAFHDLSPKHPHLLPKAPGFYGFPYRMLLAKDCDNLYMAGRCVTEDIEAHMSTRNTVGCMIMGQGAGVAAALCAKNNCNSRELPYAQLRQALLDQNVILDV